MLCHITVLVKNVIGTDGFVFQSAKLMVRLPSSKVKLNFPKWQKGFHSSTHWPLILNILEPLAVITFCYIALVDRLTLVIIFLCEFIQNQSFWQSNLNVVLSSVLPQSVSAPKKDYDKNLFTMFVCNTIVLCQWVPRPECFLALVAGDLNIL